MSKFNFVMFVAGAVVGSAAAWIFLKKHYAQIAQEEIDSVKKVFSEHHSMFNNKEQTKEEQESSDSQVADIKPDDYSEIQADYEKIRNKYDKTDEPYVISPEEYGESDDYTQISLTYYSDGILADDEDDLIDDIEGTVGEDFADHFGDYDADAICIRNDRLKCDYEILRDNRSFKDVTGMEPGED